MTFPNIAKELNEAKENVILIYAFNATGKTRLSVEYKNLTKNPDTGDHAGVYYNAYSEDLFNWDNDEENGGANKTLKVVPSSLNKLHSLLTEDAIKEKLIPFNPSYNFYFTPYKESPDIEFISFFKDGDENTPIKISRGEERIFIWCFFLALFEVEGWADIQNAHFFIDDPVSSLDDHNIFITASLLFDLIEKHFKDRKFIITTHHLGLFSILSDWLSKGEKSSMFKETILAESRHKDGDTIVITKKETIENRYRICFLEKNSEECKLVGRKRGTQLYHLLLLQLLDEANKKDELFLYHFVMLRQLLESISSFLGKGRFGYVLEKIKIEEKKMPDIINALSHQKVYEPKIATMNDTEKGMFREVFKRLNGTFPFEY